MSAPAQNVSPSPVSTRTRTVGSVASASSRTGSDRHMARVIALRRAGLLMVTVAVPSPVLTRRPGEPAAPAGTGPAGTGPAGTGPAGTGPAADVPAGMGPGAAEGPDVGGSAMR